MNDKNCVNCRFTTGKDGGSLSCQRNPVPVRVARSYWCGEWQEMAAAPQPKARNPRELKKDYSTLFVEKESSD